MIPNYGDKYDSKALFSPSEAIEEYGGDTEADVPPVVILTFQSKLFETVVPEKTDDPIPIVRGQKVHPVNDTVGVVGKFGIGAPVTATIAENLIAAGAEVLCIVGGSAGLQRSIEPTDVILADRAIRDEGASYHYLPPETDATPTEELVDHLEAAYADAGFDVHRGTTWTTSAFYRETTDEIAEYVADGVVSVEMEAASLFAVAEYRGVDSAAVFDVGDLITEEEWDAGVEYENIQPEMFDQAVETLEVYFDGK
ncbi:nucleoside phosphorylase [Haladaptatus salinisoli]|uniref:nucleoside phosphorylase n=1 Tax=Haladaptatus salinisoli TaxID=2884876 RepID=UPI001D0BDFF6|nr:nucleoside phosphorylase [Haladaptatus salinisoli]